MKKCLLCGNPFEFDSRAKKYCSEKCRKRIKYEKDRAWAMANPEKITAYAQKWREANHETVQKRGRDAYRKKCRIKLDSEGIK